MDPILDLLKTAATSQDKNYRALAIQLAPSLCPFIEDSHCPTHCADYIFDRGEAQAFRASLSASSMNLENYEILYLDFDSCVLSLPRAFLFTTLNTALKSHQAGMGLMQELKVALMKCWVQLVTHQEHCSFCSQGSQHSSTRSLLPSPGGGTALCMLLKSFPDLLSTTPAPRLLQLLMTQQLEKDPEPAKPRAAAFTRLGLRDLLEEDILKSSSHLWSKQAHTSALLQLSFAISSNDH